MFGMSLVRLFSKKQVRKNSLESSFVTLLYLTGLYYEYMQLFEEQHKETFEEFLEYAPSDEWVMGAIKFPLKHFKWWSELDIRWQIYSKGLLTC